MMNEISLPVLIAIIVGLIEVAKKLGLNSKFAPLLSVILGVGLSLMAGITSTVPNMILTGVIIGLSAIGLYSGTKSTVQTIKGQK